LTQWRFNTAAMMSRSTILLVLGLAVGAATTVGVIASRPGATAGEPAAAPPPNIAADIEALKAYVPPKDAKPSPEPDGYRIDGYRDPVPATLTGATVLSHEAALALWKSNTAVFIDVYPHAPKPSNLPPGTLWRETTHQSIENSKWVPNVGYGNLSAETEAYFKSQLEKLSGGDKAKKLVFFCLRNCWMSYNAGKRAMALGYTSVHWFPDGSDAWQEMGQLVVDAVPEK
jgi:PQQ-dependent catabolism-associated CXXCW motif protein